MSVDYIILGLLRNPSTGYAIKSDFDQVFSNFWAAQQSQIYRTLKSLETRGFLESSEESSEKGPPRRVYRRTEAGLEALVQWLDQEAEIGDLRIPYLAQLFFMDQLHEPEKTARLLRKVRDHFARRLRVLRGLEASWQEDDEAFPDFASNEDFCAHLVLRHGISRAESTLAWSQAGLERLRARMAKRTEIEARKEAHEL